MQSRKGSKVLASCPNCRLHVTQRAAGSRKESWIECPRCGQVFESKPKKNGKARERYYEIEDEENELNYIYR